MKKSYLLVLLSIPLLFSAQIIGFTPTVKVTYDASLQLGESFRRDQQFILVGNSREYYFSGYHNYMDDTGRNEKTAKSGITLSIADYLEERIIRKDGITYVYGHYTDDRLKYEENVYCQWVLYGETKIINGMPCQMAATNKFGRRWIAYFSKEYPQSLGPYKFTGLPGLIMELYDTRNDYHFTAVKIEKDSDGYQVNLKGYKKLSKKDFLKATYNLKFTLAGYPADMGEDFRKELQTVYDKKKKMYNNPLELKPFE